MNVRFKTLIKRWWPPLAWAAIIYSFSSLPNLKSDLGPAWDLVLRKLAHATEYAILAWLVLRAGSQSQNHHQPMALLAGAWLAATLFSASDEWHQTFVPGREGAFHDVILDSSGALLGAVFGWRRLNIKRNKESFSLKPHF